MSLDIKKKYLDLIRMTVLAVLFVFLQVLTVMNLWTAFNGVFAAIQYALCLLMMHVNRKKGILISILFMSISLIMVVMALLNRHTLQPLPGMVNTILYMVTIIILGKYHQKQENESVTDMLTGVLNRRGLYKDLQSRIANGEGFSVVYFSLENFKVINDNYGHAFGDELLRNVAERIQAKLGNSCSAARIGGAEFVAVLSQTMNAENTANELLELIREKSELSVGSAKINCHMTCYAGLAAYPTDSKDFEAIIKYADIAMYDAIAAKSKTALVFNKSMADGINRRMEVENLIKEGLVNDYFFLVYQPQYHLDGKKLRGFETLIRMKTPDGQFVSPGEFIPIAEKGDLVLEIDDYVLNRAMREFRDIVKSRPELTVSVNVSAKNIANPKFTEKLADIIRENDFPPQNLEVEITEYCMVDSMEITINNITALRAMGIQIALDDFGTGYTSLNYVAKLPINLLKVDKSLVDDVCKGDKNREFVHTIISMGHLMGCEVISEGVEDEDQLNCLKADGCDFVQGFVWGKPLAYDVAKDLALN